MKRFFFMMKMMYRISSNKSKISNNGLCAPIIKRLTGIDTIPANGIKNVASKLKKK
jgi:hypothetical protein